MTEDRIKKLARRLDVLAEEDERRIREEQELTRLRRDGAFNLYVICSNFVRNVNAHVTRNRLELSPAAFEPDSFREGGPNLFQINAAGRIIQLAFEATGPLITTEEFRTPYTLHGEIRWFNQESLDGMGIHERQIFLCIRGGETWWVHFDSQTHRQGRLDEDYLMELLEQLVK